MPRAKFFISRAETGDRTMPKRPHDAGVFRGSCGRSVVMRSACTGTDRSSRFASQPRIPDSDASRKGRPGPGMPELGIQEPGC